MLRGNSPSKIQNMERFKVSKYNFYIKYKENILYFNGISRSMLLFKPQEHLFFQEQFQNLNNFIQNYPTLFEFLKSRFFIIENSLDEISYIKYLNHCAIFLNKDYRITINPTLECNFKCWYCYESHKKGKLSLDVQDKIIKHIEYVLENKLIDSIDLGWFGGEPLLYFSEIVYPISLKIKSLTTYYQIPFSNHATTNAYLINVDMIKKFQEINLSSFQITIDGNERKHNLIRNENGNPSFKRIIKNVIELCERLYNCSIILRVNYDNDTLKNIDSMLDLIPSQIRKKITISLNRVWQTVTPEIKKNINNIEIFNHIYNKCLEYGYNISSADSIPKSFIRCDCDKFWNLEINYDGKIYKCTVDYNKESQGEFTGSGEIIWKDYIYANMYGKETFDNPRCLKCKLLPICLGPCSRKTIEKKQNPSCTILPCNMAGAEIDFENIIINHYKSILFKNLVK